MVRIWRAGDQLSRVFVSFITLELKCLDIEPTLEDVKTDAAKLVDIWVKDLGKESNLGRCHGVVVGEEELETEDPTWICD